MRLLYLGRGCPSFSLVRYLLIRIEPPTNFSYAGDLSPRNALHDPRQDNYGISELEVDLRECKRIEPTAVLWVTVYLMLARLKGTACRVQVPESVDVATYLKSTGLYAVLEEAGVEIDDETAPSQSNSEIVLPIVRFQDPVDVVTIANDTLSRLVETGLGSASVRPLVSDVFSESALNAVQHAESPIHAYGLIQFRESSHGNSFLCVVSDGGIGIRRSLQRNPMLISLASDDPTALELASQERITGVPNRTRGLGLSWISEEMRKPGRQMMLHSGLGKLRISDGTSEPARHTTLFPGTLLFASIPT